METNLNGAKENAPPLVAQHKRGTFNKKRTQYSKRRPKLQLPDATPAALHIGSTLRPVDGSTLEFALEQRRGRTLFRLSETGANGQCRRFRLRRTDLRALLNAIHRANSLLEAVR